MARRGVSDPFAAVDAVSDLFGRRAHVPAERAPRSPSERLAWLRLARTPRVGASTFLRLISRFGSASAALDALPAMARSGGGSLTPADPAQTAAEIEAGEALGARLLCLGAPDYPDLLAELDQPPPAIWALGRLHAIPRRATGIVGTRNASALGLRFAERLARDLAASDGGDMLVVSGLARGIDSAAHRGAVAAGGATVAVVAGGVDDVYPPENAALRDEICEAGAVISEMPIGLQPQSRHFPKRNRLISGLSLGVVVVEGAERSGSMITARAALEQGREAMATPGHPFDARAAGPNALIRDGAALIRSADDVLEAVAHRLAAVPARPAREPHNDLEIETSHPNPDDIRALVEAALGATPVSLSVIARALDAPAGAVAAAALELEIAGRLDRFPGDAVARASRDADPGAA